MLLTLRRKCRLGQSENVGFGENSGERRNLFDRADFPDGSFLRNINFEKPNLEVLSP